MVHKFIRLSIIALVAMVVLPLMAQADIIPLQPTPVAPAPTPMPALSPLSCFDFHSTLKTGNKSYEVRGLQYALIHEGWNIATAEYGTFGSDTLTGVNAFQQKYASEILTQVSAPTGAVGRLTRAKLNALYGCNEAAMTHMMMQREANTPHPPALPTNVSLAVKSVALDSNGATATFCNQTPTDIPAFPVRLRLNGIIRDFNAIGALKAATCSTETLPYSAWGLTYDPTNTTYALVSGIDPNGMYKTSQLTYPASATTTLSIAAVAGAHLSVRGITLKSNGVQSTLCNLGTLDLTSYPVRVTVNGTSKTVDVPGAYMHGQCQAVTWTYDMFGLPALPANGTSITATVNVDPNNVINEVNEFDNAAAIVGNL